MDKFLAKYGFTKKSDRLWILNNGERDIIRVSLSYEVGYVWTSKAGNYDYRGWVVTVYERGNEFLTKATMYCKFEDFEKRFIQYTEERKNWNNR